MLSIEGFKIEGNFPGVISPDHKTFDYNALIDTIQKNKQTLHQLLLKHGGLLFRGFPIENANAFATFIESLGLGNFVNYIGGDSPRDKVEDKVYTSTEAPPALHIPLHQELSFVKKFPRHIYFFCETPPAEKGETIIGDARQIYKALNPEVKKRFEEKGLTYTSNYYYKNKIMRLMNKIQRSHKSWIEVFETHKKEDVERQCQNNDFHWEWTKRDWIKVQQTRPAMVNHPETQEPVWFNQAHLYDFNPKLLGWARYLGAKLFYFRKYTRLHEVSYADGSKIARSDLYHILDVLDKNTVAFPWQKNDVMVLDNVLTLHGRAPFTGKRRILTALTS